MLLCPYSCSGGRAHSLVAGAVRSLEIVTTPDELTNDVLVRSRMDCGLATVEQLGLRCQFHELPGRWSVVCGSA